jgi:hypothetical protein
LGFCGRGPDRNFTMKKEKEKKTSHLPKSSSRDFRVLLSFLFWILRPGPRPQFHYEKSECSDIPFLGFCGRGPDRNFTVKKIRKKKEKNLLIFLTFVS